MILSHPSFALYSSCLQLSCADSATNPKKPKTYGRFLGTIFSGGLRLMEITARQGFANLNGAKK
jgi:hypothetical protein